MADTSDYSPEWGDFADTLGIDMYDLAESSAETLSAPIPIAFTSTTGNIAAIAYIPYKTLPGLGILWIQFQNGPYKFFDVPIDDATGFSSASSATTYFNATIRDLYDYEGG